MERTNLATLSQKVQTEADAYLYLEGMRWGDKTVCPHCGDDERCFYLNPANGETRTTTRGTQSARRVWKCGGCRKQFSVLTNTVMHGTKISVRTWVLVLFEMAASKNGISAREIERKYGLAPKSAWFMTQRVREAMKRDPLAGMLGGNGGTVVADETFIGGKPKNKHRQGRPARLPGTKSALGPGGGSAHLTPVLSLIDTATGEARSAVVPDVTGATLRKVIADQVQTADTTLHTDAAGQYRALGKEFAAHEWVDHGRYEYVRGNVTSNQAENFFSQLKRSLDGTHHAVSVKHLGRYLAEFDYRYSTRKMNDAERMADLIGRVGDKRLSYRPLTGRDSL